MRLNCIVVDDSSLHRIIITKLVEKHPNLHLIGDFSNAIEAKGCINLHNVDLIFLDIEMPVINGFDFVDGLQIKPQIIFITAKAEYAMKAFDYRATDYLQKPLAVNRFNISIKRAMNLYLLKSDSPVQDVEHIFIKCNLKKLKIFTAKIKWIEAFGDYVRVITEDDSNLVLSTMKSFENELSKDKFVRVHKSYIINIDKVKSINGRFAEIGITKIPLSRQKKENLVKALAFN